MKEPVKYKEGLNIYRKLDKYYLMIAGLYTKLVTVLQGNKLLPLRLTAIICISNQPPKSITQPVLSQTLRILINIKEWSEQSIIPSIIFERSVPLEDIEMRFSALPYIQILYNFSYTYKKTIFC